MLIPDGGPQGPGGACAGVWWRSPVVVLAALHFGILQEAGVVARRVVLPMVEPPGRFVALRGHLRGGHSVSHSSTSVVVVVVGGTVVVVVVRGGRVSVTWFGGCASGSRPMACHTPVAPS